MHISNIERVGLIGRCIPEGVSRDSTRFLTQSTLLPSPSAGVEVLMSAASCCTTQRRSR
jgi:hypothetical protein